MPMAFPLISSGVYGGPRQDAIAATIDTIVGAATRVKEVRGVPVDTETYDEVREQAQMESTTTPKLGDEFAEAMCYAAKRHATQTRKGGAIPYFGHLMSVSALVIEAGGSQTQAIAGLFHDAVEDQGGKPTLDEIESRFGSAVAKIVSECSDTDDVSKPPRHERKERYIAHLRGAFDDAVLVSLADKLDNARAILRDLRLHGDHL
ncbi:HD domain-containing protein [Mycolicibacterium setense]|uniref:HD domain-containing protein n=1 Tax=Mycolicibacterium setense TaxID=431269 RepID=UPI001F2925C4|nr:HD domain-containing protein [Mycolicibacterium setense]